MPVMPYNINIYSANGATLLKSFGLNSGGYSKVTVNTNGVTVTYTGGEDTYTYSGSSTFLGLSNTPNATTPDIAIGEYVEDSGTSGTNFTYYIVEDSTKTTYIRGDNVENATTYELYEKINDSYNLLASASEINFNLNELSFEEGDHVLVVKAKADGYEDSDYSNEVTYTVEAQEPEIVVPTDLTNYKVTVPSNWTCTAGFGNFNLDGSLNGNTIYTLLIGFYPSGVEAADSITDFSNGYTPSDSLIFVINGGTDATNQSLIQWFVDNNATFEKVETPEVPTDLTGYKVTVPESWNAPANNNGYYNITGTISYGSVTNAEVTSLGIGFNVSYDGAEANCISYSNGLGLHTVDKYVSFTITFSSGSDLTNTNLIQWFVDNGATFEKVEDEEETPQFVNSLIVYWGNSLSSTQIVFNFPLGLQDTLYTNNTFTNLGQAMSALNITYIASTNSQFRLYVTNDGNTTIGHRGDDWSYKPRVQDSSFNIVTGATLLNETLFAPYSWSSN